ncbi:hypothetical protein [Campylobacter coli]|uniref:hypothetical protein n=1 Tax=Campylobacter coli TaxID=195 RepID=UPI0015D95FC5|nr:hypothetical protein [Campylobacter coli]
MNLFLFFKFNSFLNTTFLEAILFTTISETKEFISSYFDFKIICILSGFLFFSIVLFLIPYNGLLFLPNEYHILDISKIIIFLVCLISVVKKPHKYFIDDFLLYSWFEAIKTIRGNANEYLMQLNDLERELKNKIKLTKLSILKIFQKLLL